MWEIWIQVSLNSTCTHCNIVFTWLQSRDGECCMQNGLCGWVSRLRQHTYRGGGGGGGGEESQAYMYVHTYTFIYVCSSQWSPEVYSNYIYIQYIYSNYSMQLTHTGQNRKLSNGGCEFQGVSPLLQIPMKSPTPTPSIH